MSQCQLAEKMGEVGISLSKNAVQQIQSGKRFVANIELAAIAKISGVEVEEVMKQEE